MRHAAAVAIGLGFTVATACGGSSTTRRAGGSGGGAAGTTTGSGGDAGAAQGGSVPTGAGGAGAIAGSPGAGGNAGSSGSGAGGATSGEAGASGTGEGGEGGCTAGVDCPGCETGADCASGSCLRSRDCEWCQGDGECSPGTLCATGVCLPPCAGEGTSCGEGRTCCAGRCVDTSRDIEHCGGCDVPSGPHACASDEFCGTLGCAKAVLANLCQVHAVAVGPVTSFSGAWPVREEAFANCDPAPPFRTIAQGAFDYINPVNGRVVGIGELVTAVRPDRSLVTAYLEQQRIAPVLHAWGGEQHEYSRSSDDSVIASVPSVDSVLDLALVELVRVPATGTLVLVVSGLSINDNVYARVPQHFAEMMLDIETYTKSWYVYESSRQGDDTSPFTLIAEAP